jgi:hypothetical protein
VIRVLALAIVMVTVSAAAVTATEQPETQLLLDLDLLREIDPRVQREVPLARDVPLLELLERLNPPAAARGGGEKKPVPKGAC